MALSLNDLTGKTVSFQLYPSSIITDDFTNVKVIGITTYEGASGEMSAAQQHALVYATLPEGTTNDYRLYNYALIKTQSGKITAIGLPWVKDDSIQVIGSTDLVVTIRNKTPEDITNLHKVLMENNFTDFAITVGT